MKRGIFLLFSALLGGAAALVRADQADDAIVAAMKLSTATSYSWTATISQNSHPLEIRGKTSAAGYSLLTFVGSSAGGGASAAKSGSSGVNTVFLGDDKYVVESNGTWVIPSDVSSPPAQAETSNRNAGGTAGSSGARGKRGRGASGGTGAPAQRRGSGGGEPDSSSATVRPKLPSGVNLPHEELAIVAANHADMHVEDGVVNGKLTEWGADLLLQPPGWMQAPPDKAAGTFRLWIKDGAVTKYELKLTAETGPGGASIKGGLAETITVEVTDVGTTKVDVPPAAKLKLGV
jgi:hypothetical protein